MKIVERIAEQIKEALSHTEYANVDVIALTQTELADLIAVELEPIRDSLVWAIGTLEFMASKEKTGHFDKNMEKCIGALDLLRSEQERI